MYTNSVFTAFDLLFEEIEKVINNLNNEATKTFHKGKYTKAKKLAEDTKRLEILLKEIGKLQKEWHKIFSRIEAHKCRIKKGLKTPEEAFKRPILEALSTLGGSAPAHQILDLVEEKMKNQLNEYDYQTLPSNHNTVRWKNTVQWCRYTMIQEGLLKDNSPRGIWEISEKGLEYLRRHYDN